MSGKRVVFVGGTMTAVVQAIREVHELIGVPPVIVGGVAVMCRLSTPGRATADLDVVDRLLGPKPHLEILRTAFGVTPVEPAAVILPTEFGEVKVDVIEVRQVELDQPSDDPGDRLYASAHAWANDTASDVTIRVLGMDNGSVQVRTKVAEPGPLIAMKSQAVMNRSMEKQGTDLLDIVRLTLDPETQPLALHQVGEVNHAVARDLAIHVDLWLIRRKVQALRWIRSVGDQSVTMDDLDLVAELLLAACDRDGN